MTLSLEGWPTKAKEAPSPHEVRLAPLDTNPVFHSLGDNWTHHQTSDKQQDIMYIKHGLRVIPEVFRLFYILG